MEFCVSAVNQEEVAFALSTSASAQQLNSQLLLNSSQHSNPNVMTSSNVMASSMYNPVMISNPQMTSSMMGRSLDEASFFDMQMQQQQQQQHNPGVQIIEGHGTPTHGQHGVPMCEVAIYNPGLPPNSMTQSYHQTYSQQLPVHHGQSFHGIPENQSMEESWHEFP